MRVDRDFTHKPNFTIREYPEMNIRSKSGVSCVRIATFVWWVPYIHTDRQTDRQTDTFAAGTVCATSAGALLKNKN